VITEEFDAAPSVPGVAASADPAPESPFPAPAQRALTFGLLLSALRCTVQYILLPFVLPWIGVAASIPPWITLLLGGLALASLTRNVRYLWRLHHVRRWNYLAVASVVATALVIFMVVDLRAYFGS
jgi:ABC-type iron transport system FetAB permease component